MKRYIAALTVLVFMLFAAPAAAAADTLPPYENAEGYVLMEASTQSVLSGKNADITYNCSYLSKLMSLLLIAEDIETGRYLLSTEVTGRHADSRGASQSRHYRQCKRRDDRPCGEVRANS